MATILKKQEIQLLAETRELLEELLETVELSNDRVFVRAYRQAVRDVKAGKTRSYKDFRKRAH